MNNAANEIKNKRFLRTKNALKRGVSKNMLDASKDPQGFIKKTENMNITGSKGIVM